jgi:hypothetical protein
MIFDLNKLRCLIAKFAPDDKAQKDHIQDNTAHP